MQKLCEKLFFQSLSTNSYQLYPWHQQDHPKMPAKRPWISRSWQLLYLTSRGTSRGTDHLALALLRCIQQVTRRSKEECGHKQISHSKCVGRFQIQGFHIELSMGVLRNCKLHSAKCRTTMTFQDHMWKLPWKKTSFTTMTTCGVPAANSRLPLSHAAKLHSSWFGSFITNSYMR